MYAQIIKNHGPYPHYPDFSMRNKLTEAEYDDWDQNGRFVGIATGAQAHPHRIAAIKKGLIPPSGIFDATTFHDSCTGDYALDAIGRPVHPYAKELLIEGVAVERLGALWYFGPNLCVDPILLGASIDGTLKTVIIERGDTGRKAFPGGFLDKNETPIIGAMRELIEETDPSPRISPSDILEYHVLPRVMIPDARTTLNAWIESYPCIFLLKTGLIDRIKFRGSDDATAAWTATLNDDFKNIINPGHVQLVESATSWFEDRFEALIFKSGLIDFETARF